MRPKLRSANDNGPDIDWASLAPMEAAIVREFAAGLRAIHEIETERMRQHVRQLEFLRDGLREITAEMRAELKAREAAAGIVSEGNET